MRKKVLFLGREGARSLPREWGVRSFGKKGDFGDHLGRGEGSENKWSAALTLTLGEDSKARTEAEDTTDY